MYPEDKGTYICEMVDGGLGGGTFFGGTATSAAADDAVTIEAERRYRALLYGRAGGTTARVYRMEVPFYPRSVRAHKRSIGPYCRH